MWATDAGRSEAGAGTPGLSLAPTLDVALACLLPAEALRAFARLQLAAVIARWHLAREHPSGWSGFIALGPTKTGKTSIASLVCRVFGIEEVRAVKVARYETPGSLFARRERDRALGPRLAARGALVPDLIAAEAESEQRQAIERDRRRRTAEQQLEFVFVREHAAGELLQARDAMGRGHDPDRQPLARALTTAAEQIRGARSDKAVLAAIQAAMPYHQRACAYKTARDQAAAQRERVAAEAQQRRQLERVARQRERQRALLPVAAQFVAALPQRSSASAELGRCPSCDRVYPTRVNMGIRLEKCTACDCRLIPVRPRSSSSAP